MKHAIQLVILFYYWLCGTEQDTDPAPLSMDPALERCHAQVIHARHDTRDRVDPHQTAIVQNTIDL